MAIVHFINSRVQQTAKGMLYVLRYTMQESKTVADDGTRYVSGINCTPESAHIEFGNTKKLYGKTDGRLYYHFVQSFSVEENISPQTAHEIALRFAAEAEKLNGFEIVAATHCDRDHIHTHFVMNSVSFESGRKFHISQREVEELMEISDSICREYGMSVVEPRAKSERAKPMSDREYRSAVNQQSWKIKLEAAISTVMRSAASREHFIDLMEQYGYQVKWSDTRKNITYITPDGKACRDSKLHYEKYLKESMEYEFIYRAQICAGLYNRGTAAYSGGGKAAALRGGDRSQLEGFDLHAECSDRNSEKHSGQASHSGNGRKAGGLYEPAASSASGALHRDNGYGFPVPDESGENHERYDGGDIEDSGGYRITGWENERKIFAGSLTGTGAGEYAYQEADTYLADPYSGAYSMGADTAYLAAELSNIIDEDAPVEDCTTRHFRSEKKKNHGPTMGGI